MLLLCTAQALLWVGITRAKRKPTKLHPYGYMRDKFVFSLISAVGIFCLGAGVSVWHGCAGLLTPEPVEHLGWSIAGARLSHWCMTLKLKPTDTSIGCCPPVA